VKQPKFVQITCGANEDPYALDEDGGVWNYHWPYKAPYPGPGIAKSERVPGAWHKLSTKRVTGEEVPMNDG